MSKSRAFWRNIVRETDEICRDGLYQAPSGNLVSIVDALNGARTHTKEFGPDEPIVRPMSRQKGSIGTRFEVTTETTLQAASRLSGPAAHPVAALNFASAHNPGGGYQKGAMAQEEALAYATGLVPCLEDCKMYRAHTQGTEPPHLYGDWLIYSERVPVFRDDEGQLLETPWCCSFYTSPAPNANAHFGANAHRLEAARTEVRTVMRRRIERLLALASLGGDRRLVLGAWGCGGFGCDPTMVAHLFAEALNRSFRDDFSHVTFAIKEANPDHPTVAAFRKAFPS